MPRGPVARRAYPWWITLVLAFLLASLAWLTAGLVLQPVTAGFVPVAVHSHLLADYSADPHAALIPAIDVRILAEVQHDQTGTPSAETATPVPVEAWLQAPVPSITLAPGQPTFSPVPPTATPSPPPATDTPPPPPTATPVPATETPSWPATRTPTLLPVIRPTLSVSTPTPTWGEAERPTETPTVPERPPLETEAPAPTDPPAEVRTEAPTERPPIATETRPPPPPTDTPEPYQPPPGYP